MTAHQAAPPPIRVTAPFVRACARGA
jgi:hypothetical protein